MEETKNEIKKLLYKQRPEAYFRYIRMGVAYYYADLDEMRVHFEIPVKDMGSTDFGPTEDGHLLIRWIVEPKHTT